MRNPFVHLTGLGLVQDLGCSLFAAIILSLAGYCQLQSITICDLCCQCSVFMSKHLGQHIQIWPIAYFQMRIRTARVRQSISLSDRDGQISDLLD